MLKDTYLKNSMIPRRYLEDIPLKPGGEDDAKTFKELFEIKNNIKKFVDDGNNLLICSTHVGNGKTTWATKMLKSYIDSVGDVRFRNECPALYVNVNNLLSKKKLAINNPEYQNEVNLIEKMILTAKIVLFDDVGVKDLSQYDLASLYFWIDERTSKMMTNIYTSNLLPSQMQTYLDGRLFSRIVNYSIVKEIKDGDHRKC